MRDNCRENQSRFLYVKWLENVLFYRQDILDCKLVSEIEVTTLIFVALFCPNTTLSAFFGRAIGLSVTSTTSVRPSLSLESNAPYILRPKGRGFTVHYESKDTLIITPSFPEKKKMDRRMGFKNPARLNRL